MKKGIEIMTEKQNEVEEGYEHHFKNNDKRKV